MKSVIETLKNRGIPYAVIQITSHFGNTDTFLAYPSRYNKSIGGETWQDNKKVTHTTLKDWEIRQFKREIRRYNTTPLIEGNMEPFGYAYEPKGQNSFRDWVKTQK